RAVLLRPAGFGACTRQRFGEFGEPLGQNGGGQRRHLKVADRRINVRLRAVTGVYRAFPIGFQNLEIVFDSSPHRQWAGDAISNLRAPHHVLASLVLRLRKTENGCPVRVTEIIGRADLLDYVAAASDIMSRDPCTCDSGPSLAAFELAVAD